MDVRWIKLTTDMFDNRKIKHLRKLPEGNSIVLIWVMLLTLAGRCNASGFIFLTENIPYSTKMLADELGFDESIISLAIASLEELGMILTTDEGFLAITGWEKHQSIDKLSEIREYNRIAKQKSRDRQKLLQDVNDKSMTSQPCQDTDIDIEEDKEKDIDIDTNNKQKKSKYGEFKNVYLTDDEFKKLGEEFGEAKRDSAIKFLDEYITEKGYKSKSHNLAIRRWVFDAVDEQNRKHPNKYKVSNETHTSAELPKSIRR